MHKYPCERCGQEVGPGYYSDARCNTHGIGVCLCLPCCKVTESLDDETFAAGAWRQPAAIEQSKFEEVLRQAQEVAEFCDEYVDTSDSLTEVIRQIREDLAIGAFDRVDQVLAKLMPGISDDDGEKGGP